MALSLSEYVNSKNDQSFHWCASAYGAHDMKFFDGNSILIALVAFACLSSAHAQSPLVHLPLDGSAENIGSAGAAELFVPAGADQPRFIAGRRGQGLSFGKGGAVVIPSEFDQDKYPRASVTMWIKIDKETPNEREILSLGPGSGLLFRVTAKRQINVRSYRQATHKQAFPLGEWVFVAAVVDNAAGTIRIQQNDEIHEAKNLDIRTPYSVPVAAPGFTERKHYIFVGADDFNSAAKELKHISLDDVRLYAEALSPAQIEAIRQSAIGDDNDAGKRVIASPESRLPAIDRSGAPTSMPEDIGQNRTIQRLPEPDPEPSLNVPTPIENTPDRGLTIPEGLPGQELDEDLGQLPDAPTPEIATEISCTPVPIENVQFSATSSDFPADFIAALRKAKSCDLELNVATVNEKGQWIVATADQIAHSRDLPAPLIATLVTVERQYGGLDAADISESGVWMLSAGGKLYQSGMSTDAQQKATLAARVGGVKFFDFHPSDPSKWVLIDGQNTVSGAGLPSGLLKALADLPNSKRTVRQIRFGAGDRWALLGSGSWVVTSSGGMQTLSQLTRFQNIGRRLDHIVFPNKPDGYALYSAKLEASAAADPITKLEQDLRFNVGTSGAPDWRAGSVWARMQAHNLKAVSIAMVRNNKIEWARGYGIRDANNPESYVFSDTTFDAASISKPIATFGLLQLVDDGKLSLTQDGVLKDVEGILKTGQRSKFRKNVRPEAGNLIQVLQHCLSICYSGSANCMNGGGAGGAATYSVNAAVPTTAEMIMGKNPADALHSLLRVGNSGLRARYSTANFLLVQALMDVHGGGFLTHMNKLLNDLEMTNSTYKSPYPKRNGGNHARGWSGAAVTPSFAYGEMAGASLVSTPVDVAKFVTTVNILAENSRANGKLSYGLVQKFLGRDNSIYESNNYPICRDPSYFGTTGSWWGLSVGHDTRSNNGWGGKEIYTHGGTHNGYRAIVVGLPTEKAGLVVFMSGTRDDANAFFGELRRAIVREYGI